MMEAAHPPPASEEPLHATPKTPPPSLFMRIAAWAVFGVLLLYASGAPVLFAFLYSQCGGSFSEAMLQVLFPFGFWNFEIEADGSLANMVTQSYMSISTPWFVMATLWECVIIFYVLTPDQQPLHKPRVNDTISSISLGILMVLFYDVVLLTWSTYLYQFIWTHWRITDAFSDVNNAVNFWLCFVVYDFFYYVYHRTSHWMSWLWAAHVTHHSSEEYNLSTALRQSVVDFLTPSSLFAVFGLAFLFPPELDALMGTLTLLYQFWIHTQLVPPLGRIEYVINTASLHRIHHARNPSLLGKNYAAVLSLWDWLGGTLLLEESTNEAKGEEIHYGVIPPLHSWNPLWANVHHIHHLLFVQPKWHGYLKAPFVHWTPPGGKCPKLGSRLNPWEKYDLKPQSQAVARYVLWQFGLCLLASAYLLLIAPSAAWLEELGLGKDMALTLQYGVLVAAIAVALTSVASFESARTAQELRTALLANACLHLTIAAVAVAAVASAALPIFALVIMAIYLVVHSVAIARLWPKCQLPLVSSEN